MKKIIYSLLLVSFAFTASAQWINSIQYQPSNPTANDTITFYVGLSFPSGTCDQHTQGFNINGNKIEAFALHCLGMLTYICNHTDTFKVNPLAAGIYSFHFQLDAGMLPFPCTPGIIPGPSDSVSFVVNPVTGVNQEQNPSVIVLLKGNELTVQTDSRENGLILIYDINGKLVHMDEIVNGFLRLSTDVLSKGKYMYSITLGSKKWKEGTFIKP